MKRILFIGFICMMLFAMTGFSSMSAASPMNANSTNHTYTVLVGAGNSQQGVSLMSYFPNKLRIHVGDTVVWKANSHEIHTVTFLAGAPMPDLLIPAPQGLASPLMFNPLAAFPAAPQNGQYDGSTYVNSAVMSLDPGQVLTFSLTFTTKGTFEYMCLVHGMMMSAEIDVVDNSVRVPSPAQVNNEAASQMAHLWSSVPRVLEKARRQVNPPVHHSDGTTTWKITVGYSSGMVDVMRFFPSTVEVRPGDTVEWDLSSADVAPHTITFLNGNTDPDLVLPVPQPNNQPPILLLNPAVLFPSQAVTQGQPLNKTDFFNAGLLNPAPQGPTSFSIKIGNVRGVLNYQCLLHDTSGMLGKLIVSH
jgi:plastocyanin